MNSIYISKYLNKKQIKELPNWIKKNIRNCKITGKSKKIIIDDKGRKYHLNNKLNDLPGSEWNFFLRSVINTRYPTTGKEGYAHKIRKIHPSPKPPQLMKSIIEFFTKEDEIVFDYFMGVGGTLLGASLCNRKCLGIDLNKQYIDAYKLTSKYLNLNIQETIHGNSLDIMENEKKIKNFLNNYKFSLIAIDPPYFDMMKRKKTGEAMKRKKSTSATPFSSSKKDLGNMNKSEFFSNFLRSVKFSMKFLKNEGHFAIFIKDLQPKRNEPNLLHAEMIYKINEIKNLNYIGAKIWVDESINLFPYGYPFSYVNNLLHQYILFFKKSV